MLCQSLEMMFFKFVVESTFTLQKICLKMGFLYNVSQIDNKFIETTMSQNKDFKLNKTTKTQTQDSQNHKYPK